MYMKKYIFLAASALTLASCSSDDFLGDTPGSTPTSANSAIKFDGNAGKISRATQNTGSAAEMLGKEFKIYGVKSGTTSGNGYTPVFINYLLWYDEGTKNNTTTNNSGWEYVGTHGTTETSPQTIKFWDYASADYRFVAGAPSSAFTFNTKTDEKYIETATITDLGGHINANSTGPGNTFNPIYVAEPKVVAKANYKELVQFNFVRQQSMVRVGIYETIPGYKIKEITFYKQGANGLEKEENSHNIILTSTTQNYFVGGSNVTGTITYDWTTPSYSLAYKESDGLKKSQNWYGGAFANGVEATKTTEETVAKLYGTDKDMANNGYFTVMSTVAGTDAKAILIKCDYTLESEDNSGETIKVTGATAAIPAAYSKWDVNTRYTYLFKISENTNGYTGDDHTKTGLYPITFNAAVKDTELGTVTTFTTPSITTYQASSVTDDGIKYVANKEIEVTVTESTSGTIKNLSTGGTSEGNVSIYMFTKDITEAEMQILGPKSGTAVNCTANSNKVTFTPKKAGWYVIQYLAKAKNTEDNTPAVYTYKVVKVETAPATK